MESFSMKPKITIYLAGTIKKGHENPNESFWTDGDLNLIKESLSEYDVVFLNPAFRTDDLSCQRSVFGRDMLQVFCSNFVFVDARDRRGLGVGAEMMWAKLHKIPVIIWAPKNSHYNKEQATLLGVAVSNYIHPFVEALSDSIVPDLQEGSRIIQSYLSNPTSLNVKGLDWIESAMQFYKDTQLKQDIPMLDLATAGDEISERINRICTFRNSTTKK